MIGCVLCSVGCREEGNLLTHAFCSVIGSHSEVHDQEIACQGFVTHTRCTMWYAKGLVCINPSICNKCRDKVKAYTPVIWNLMCDIAATMKSQVGLS